jgi:hypothetical protein
VEKDMKDLFLSGNLNPRTNTKYTIDQINTFLASWRGSMGTKIVANRNWKDYKDSKFILSNNKPEESQATYGAA